MRNYQSIPDYIEIECDGSIRPELKWRTSNGLIYDERQDGAEPCYIMDLTINEFGIDKDDYKCAKIIVNDEIHHINIKNMRWIYYHGFRIYKHYIKRKTVETLIDSNGEIHEIKLKAKINLSDQDIALLRSFKFTMFAIMVLDHNSGGINI